MGFGGISPFQLIIILLIILLLFGGKRLRSLGSDLGSAIKGFRKSMDESDKKSPQALDKDDEPGQQDLKESQQNKSDKPKL